MNRLFFQPAVQIAQLHKICRATQSFVCWLQKIRYGLNLNHHDLLFNGSIQYITNQTNNCVGHFRIHNYFHHVSDNFTDLHHETGLRQCKSCSGITNLLLLPCKWQLLCNQTLLAKRGRQCFTALHFPHNASFQGATAILLLLVRPVI